MCVFYRCVLPDSCYLGESDGQQSRSFEVLFSPENVRSAPRKFVMLFHLSDSATAGAEREEGYLFLFCLRRLNPHTHVCSRPVKVTKKCFWPWLCVQKIEKNLIFPAWFGTEVGQAVVPAYFLTGPTSSSIHPPFGYTLICSAFCQTFDFLSFNLDLYLPITSSSPSPSSTFLS